MTPRDLPRPSKALGFWSQIFPYGIWALLALTAMAMTVAIFASDDPTMLHQVVHPSGEFSARFLVVTMATAPGIGRAPPPVAV